MKVFQIILLFSLLISSHYVSAKINVTFINPGHPNTNNTTGGFWFKVTSFMKAAAQDLDINLTVLYAERNHLNLSKLAKTAVSEGPRPDFIIIVNEIGQGIKQLEITNKAKIKTFFMLNTLTSPKELRKFKSLSLRNKNNSWIGSFVPNNYFAGFHQLSRLVKHAQNNLGKTKFNIIGLGGDFITPASIERNNGLKDASVKNIGNLQQIIYCSWSHKIAFNKTLKIFKKYPNTNIIWSANDPIALGALKAVKQLGKTPGKDVIIGGLNWDMPALKSIQKGEIQVSMGGHFMVGGWSLVILHDHFRGGDYLTKNPNLAMKIFDAIDKTNVQKYLDHFENEDWGKIDFKKFSKIHNKELNEYNFSLKKIFEQL